MKLPYEECKDCSYKANKPYQDWIKDEQGIRAAAVVPMDLTIECGKKECELENKMGGFPPSPDNKFIKLNKLQLVELKEKIK